MAIWALVLAALFLVLSRPAAGGYFMDGNSLYATCQDHQTACEWYLIGFSDLASLDIVGNKKWICVPVNVTGAQLRDLVLDHLKANPERRHWVAAALVHQALQNAFPCE